MIYERVFGQQHRGWKDVPRSAAWAGVLFGVLVADSVISDVVRAAGGPVAQGLVIYAGVAAFFWWTMHFLLAGRVSWRLLLRPAILTVLFWIGLELFSSFYFSASVISDSKLYGTIGVVFSLMIWFIAIGAVIALGAVAGATWSQRKGHSRRTRPDHGVGGNNAYRFGHFSQLLKGDGSRSPEHLWMCTEGERRDLSGAASWPPLVLRWSA